MVKARCTLFVTGIVVEDFEPEMVVNEEFAVHVGTTDIVSEAIPDVMRGGFALDYDGHVVEVETDGILLNDASAEVLDLRGVKSLAAQDGALGSNLHVERVVGGLHAIPH